MDENENGKDRTPQILVIGVGGAGCRVCEMLEEEGMHTMTFGGGFEFEHKDSYKGLHYDLYYPPVHPRFYDARNAKWIAEGRTEDIKKWMHAAFLQMKTENEESCE